MFVKAINPTSLVTVAEEDTLPVQVGKDAPSLDANLGKQSQTTSSDLATLLAARKQDAKEVSEIYRTETAPVSSNYRIQFNRNEESRRTSIAVIDKVSGKIIREIPPEKLLKMTERIQQSMGMIFDSRI